MLSWLSTPAAKKEKPASPPPPPPSREVTDTIKEEKLSLDPISAVDQPFFDLFMKQHGMHWSPGELNFSKDKSDYDKLPEDLRLLFDKILAFFNSCDSIVIENTTKYFQKNAESTVIEYLYGEQIYFEILHVITYSSAMATYISDTEKRQRLIKSFKHDPLIYRRELWMCQRMSDKVTEAERILAFTCAEGVNFVSSFLVIFYLRTTGRFGEFAQANQLVARDEICIHVQTGIMRFNQYHRGKLTNDEITNIVEESVELELEFARALIPNGVVENLHLSDMENHIKNLGNFILEEVGVKTRWDIDRSTLPPWLSFLNLRSHTNFYERTVTDYQTPKAVSENPANDVDW